MALATADEVIGFAAVRKSDAVGRSSPTPGYQRTGALAKERRILRSRGHQGGRHGTRFSTLQSRFFEATAQSRADANHAGHRKAPLCPAIVPEVAAMLVGVEPARRPNTGGTNCA